MPYNLKPTEPPFEVVDGPFAGRKYDRKGIYAEIPPRYENCFQPVNAETRISENAEKKKANADTRIRVSEADASTHSRTEVTHE